MTINDLAQMGWMVGGFSCTGSEAQYNSDMLYLATSRDTLVPFYKQE